MLLKGRGGRDLKKGKGTRKLIRELGSTTCVQWLGIMQALGDNSLQVPASDTIMSVFVLVCLVPQLNGEF